VVLVEELGSTLWTFVLGDAAQALDLVTALRTVEVAETSARPDGGRHQPVRRAGHEDQEAPGAAKSVGCGRQIALGGFLGQVGHLQGGPIEATAKARDPFPFEDVDFAVG